MNILAPKGVKLILTCGLSSNHGVSGHLYELIEYYYYFKFYKNINCCILIPFKFRYEQFIQALDKYNFTQSELSDIIKNVIIDTSISVIKGNILFVDGVRSYFKNCIIDGKVFGFRCALDSGFTDGILFQDKRLYNDYLDNSIHYVKKVLFEKFKAQELYPGNNALIYATRNCRELQEDYFLEFSQKYHFDRVYVVSDTPYEFLRKPFINLKPPVKDIFKLFKTYIYTPIQTKYCKEFDCSPRFPAECKFYGREVIYDIPFIYPGLGVRLQDMEHLEKLSLTASDHLAEMMGL